MNWTSVSEPAGVAVADTFDNPAPSPLNEEADINPLALMFPLIVTSAAETSPNISELPDDTDVEPLFNK